MLYVANFYVEVNIWPTVTDLGSVFMSVVLRLETVGGSN